MVYYGGEGVPCPCPADGLMLAIGASPDQGTVQVAAEKSPPGTFAVAVIRPRRPKIHRTDLVPAEARRDQPHDPGSAGTLHCGDGATRTVHGRAREVAGLRYFFEPDDDDELDDRELDELDDDELGADDVV